MKYLPEFDLYIDNDCCIYRSPCRKDGKVSCDLLPVKVMKNMFGYLNVHRMVNHKLRTFMVHRIIATAFIPNPDNKPEVDHINRIIDDNRPENLRWVTRQENADNRSKVRFSDDPIEQQRIERSRQQSKIYYQSNKNRHNELKRKYYQELYPSKRQERFWK